MKPWARRKPAENQFPKTIGGPAARSIRIWWSRFLLVLSGDYGNIVYRNSAGITYPPSSLLRVSKYRAPLWGRPGPGRRIPCQAYFA